MTYKQHEGENFCCDALNYIVRIYNRLLLNIL